jgi:hypothetical protein
MADPWFEPAWKFGAYFGAGIGMFVGLMGGLLGSASFFVARGQGKRWILGAYLAMATLGVVLLLVGSYAFFTGQPYAIWYPLAMGGVPTTLVFGLLYPVIAARYREAEQRKIDAAGLRNS